MKKTRGLILIMLTIVAILVGGTTVKAEDYSVKASLSYELPATLYEGATINILFGFSSIDVGENPGISGMTADIEYDTKVFEPISADTMEGKAGWSAAYSKHLVLSRLPGCSKTTGTVVSIPFKVLNGFTAKETTITIKNIEVSGTSGDWTSGDISVEPVSVTIKADEGHGSGGSNIDVPNEDPTQPTDPTDPTNPTEPTNPNVTDNGNNGNGSGSSLGTSADGKNGDTNSKDSKNGSTDKTTSSKKIPAAGLNMYVVSAIVVVAIAGTIGFVLYARLKKEIK